MDDITLIKPHLTSLKLTGLLETLDYRMKQAVENRWSHSHFLMALLTDETQRRENKKLARRMVKSGLDPSKTFETFDFTFNTEIPELALRELATGQFIQKSENILLLGPSGVGKSHLAQAIAQEAIRLGNDVVHDRTVSLMKWLWSGRGDGTHERRMRDLCRCPLLVLDDFGLEPLSEEQQADLYEIICRRYNRGSIIITSNRDFGEWMGVFSNTLMASAAMDRLVHHASRFVISGKSHRAESFMTKNSAGVKI
jgi:DNA replication protein DnaC